MWLNTLSCVISLLQRLNDPLFLTLELMVTKLSELKFDGFVAY